MLRAAKREARHNRAQEIVRLAATETFKPVAQLPTADSLSASSARLWLWYKSQGKTWADFIKDYALG
jgi:hypothetical protein